MKRKNTNKNKNFNKRCVMSNGLVNRNGKEVIFVKYAVDYVKKLGYEIKKYAVALGVLYMLIFFLSIHSAYAQVTHNNPTLPFINNPSLLNGSSISLTIISNVSNPLLEDLDMNNFDVLNVSDIYGRGSSSVKINLNSPNSINFNGVTGVNFSIFDARTNLIRFGHTASPTTLLQILALGGNGALQWNGTRDAWEFQDDIFLSQGEFITGNGSKLSGVCLTNGSGCPSVAGSPNLTNYFLKNQSQTSIGNNTWFGTNDYNVGTSKPSRIVINGTDRSAQSSPDYFKLNVTREFNGSSTIASVMNIIVKDNRNITACTGFCLESLMAFSQDLSNFIISTSSGTFFQGFRATFTGNPTYTSAGNPFFQGFLFGSSSPVNIETQANRTTNLSATLNVIDVNQGIGVNNVGTGLGVSTNRLISYSPSLPLLAESIGFGGTTSNIYGLDYRPSQTTFGTANVNSFGLYYNPTLTGTVTTNAIIWAENGNIILDDDNSRLILGENNNVRLGANTYSANLTGIPIQASSSTSWYLCINANGTIFKNDTGCRI